MTATASYFRQLSRHFRIEECNLMAYAAGWRAEYDFYESYWTANMWEYERGRFVKALNLGNRFHVGSFSCDLEYMTRASDLRYFFINDFTAIIAPSYEIGDMARIFAKCGYERVREDTLFEDYGKGIFYGAGVEFFLLKDDKDVRLHATWSSSQFFGNFLNAGLTWKMDLTRAAKHLFQTSK